MLLLVGTALVGLVVLGIAVLPFQVSGAPAQATTAVMPVGSLTPVFTPPTPEPTNPHWPPTFKRPTPYAGPTVTASGPLLAQDAVSLRNLYRKIPTTIGGFKTITYEQDQLLTAGGMSFLLEDAAGLRYAVEVSFQGSAHPAYVGFLRVKSRMPTAQAVQVGDLAYIAPQDPAIIGVMQYRNALVLVYRANLFDNTSTLTPVPLSAVRAAAILRDLRAWLSQTPAISTALPSTPTPIPPNQ